MVHNKLVSKEVICISNFFHGAKISCTREQKTVGFKNIFTCAKFPTEFIASAKTFSGSFIYFSLPIIRKIIEVLIRYKHIAQREPKNISDILGNELNSVGAICTETI